jgi:hypothetical protein
MRSEAAILTQLTTRRRLSAPLEWKWTTKTTAGASTKEMRLFEEAKITASNAVIRFK